MTLNRGQGFDPDPVHIGFVVQNVALVKSIVLIFGILNYFVRMLRFSLHYHVMLIHALIHNRLNSLLSSRERRRATAL